MAWCIPTKMYHAIAFMKTSLWMKINMAHVRPTLEVNSSNVILGTKLLKMLTVVSMQRTKKYEGVNINHQRELCPVSAIRWRKYTVSTYGHLHFGYTQFFWKICQPD